jgi:hypothetical protein
MAQPIDLTFAEIEFLLRARPEQAVEVRADLRINPEASSDVVLASGVASLLVRGLCVVDGEDVRPTDPLAVVAAALSASTSRTEAAGWSSGPPATVHIYDGPYARVAVYPGSYGRFTVEPLDAGESLAAPLIRFLAACTAPDSPAAVVVQSRRGGGEVSLAVARDDAGAWSMSDSIDNPDASTATSRDGVLRRFEELFGGQPAAAAR